MRTGLFALLLLIVSSALGILLAEHQSRLILLYDNWQIEMSLVTLVLMLILALFALLAVAACLSLIRHCLAWLATWQQRSAQRRQLRRVSQGVQQLTAGNWRIAERLLLPYPLGNPPLAAHSATSSTASDALPAAIKPVDWERLLRLLEAQTSLLTGQPQQCLAIVEQSPLSDPMATLLRSLAHEQLGDPITAAREISRLQHTTLLSEQEMTRHLVPLFQRALQQLAAKRELAAVRQLWTQLRSPWSKSPILQAHYALALLACGETKEATSLLRRVLRQKKATRALPDLFLQIAFAHHLPISERMALIDHLAHGAWTTHIMVRLAQASLALEEGNPEKARQLLPEDHLDSEALESEAARLALAHVYQALDQPERAARLFDRIYMAGSPNARPYTQDIRPAGRIGAG